MTMQPFTQQHSLDETPFYHIKTFGKIYFKHKSFMFPRTKLKRVSNLLSNNNVISNSSTLNKSLLGFMNIIR